MFSKSLETEIKKWLVLNFRNELFSTYFWNEKTTPASEYTYLLIQYIVYRHMSTSGEIVKYTTFEHFAIPWGHRRCQFGLSRSVSATDA